MLGKSMNKSHGHAQMNAKSKEEAMPIRETGHEGRIEERGADGAWKTPYSCTGVLFYPPVVHVLATG